MAVRTLAFDTSGDLTSVAVCDGPEIVAEDDRPGEGRHAEELVPRIERCLQTARIALAQIDLIGVGVGPGSFTGVRVGVATAKGLGLALQKPVSPVVSLDALAFAARDAAEWLVPCLDAFKGEVFAAVYRVEAGALTPVLEPFHALPDQVATRLRELGCDASTAVFGSGRVRYPDAFTAWQRLDPALDRPRARTLAALSLRAFERNTVPELARVAPLYLRGSDAQLPKTPLRVS
jgi:tRNA threonylcarbamoyladenosine biosynthesis protein TsaB